MREARVYVIRIYRQGAFVHDDGLKEAKMKTRKRCLAGLLGIGGLTCAVATPLAALAGEQMQIAQTKINKGDKFEVVLDDKNAGRLVFFTSWHAVYKQTKGGNLLDGVNNTGAGYVDLTQGHGHESGFDVNEKGGDTYKSGWAADCYTTTGPDGKPQGHCDGGWYVVPNSGTGRFAGLSGGGTFEAHALPSGEYEVNSTGTIEK
jgi:hypothetical protein